MEHAEEASELGAEILASMVVEAGVGDLAPGKERRAEERPVEALARSTDEPRLRNRNGEERRESRQHRELALDAGDRDLAPRKAKHPPVLDDPGRIVPALAEQFRGGRIELGKLLAEEHPHERLVDDDLRIPLGHRSNLPGQRPGALCEAPPVHWQLVALSVVLLVFAAISRRIEGTWITAPMFFMAAGLVVGVEALDLVDPASTGLEVKTLAEATLTVVLFSDASRIDLRALRSSLGIPARLLGIGLPLTIIAGFVAAIVLLGDLAWPEALVVAIILAPTDAALGQVVVTSRRLPVRVRQSLNVESGLNDGICVPLFLIALAVALAEEGAIGNGHAAQLVAEKIGYGVVGGVVAGAAAAAIVVYAGGRRFVDETWLQVVPLAGALLAFALAEAIGGSGFIGAFVGGAIFGGLRRHRGGDVSQLTEQAGAVLAAVTFVVFGAVLLGPALHDLTWQIALYAVLSLTLVRMLPVAVAMLGTRARRPTVAFLGWFGPRGAASIVFALLVLEEGGLRNEELILTTAFVTVGLSVLAHGATAAPLAARYGSWLESRSPQEVSALESGGEAEVRWRLQHDVAAP